MGFEHGAFFKIEWVIVAIVEFNLKILSPNEIIVQVPEKLKVPVFLFFSPHSNGEF